MVQPSSPAPRHSALAQLWALLWKSYIIRRVHWISSIFELICPLLFILVVASSYSNATAKSPGSPDNPNDSHNATIGPIYYPTRYFDGDDRWTIFYDFEREFLRSSDFILFYAPDNEITRQLMIDFPRNHTGRDYKLVPCKDEADLDGQLQSITDDHYQYSSQTAGIFFENVDNTQAIKEGQLSYKIKLLTTSTFMDMTSQLFPQKFNQAPVDNTYPQYLYKVFAKYQAYVNRRYIDILCTENKIADCEKNFHKQIMVNRMAYPVYANPRTSSASIFDFIGMILIFCYIVFCPLVVKRITDEKSSKARELLRMIGMSDLMYWSSHFINNFIVILIHTLLITTIMHMFSGPIFAYASWFLVFCFVLLFGIQLILFSLTITTVFNRPVIATIVTTMAWILIGAVITALLLPNLSTNRSVDVTATNPWRRLACLTPMGSIIMFGIQLGEYENFGQALTFGNMGHSSVVYGSFTALNTFLLQLASIPIYCFLIWYLDNVWPFQDGVPKPVYYLFQPSYWIPSKAANMSSEFSEWDKTDETLDPKLFEPIHTQDPAAICVKNVSKTFTSGIGNTKTAVDNLTFDIYPNQITVLLGHNGAGKSTTMNMITGMFKPNAGNVYVHGFDVATQTKSARQSLSLCPQENIIFTELTVSQHLWLFAMLKGSPAGTINLEIDKVLQLLKLGDKKHEMATNLSGGMKRKLSLGIALIGNTNLLILDEPTSGMDPDARRVIWDLLLSIRREKTILITTHYMEEADVLADRIAIMNAGKLGCTGSPYFLKNALGTGYRLRIAKLPGFKTEKFMNTVRHYIPTAHLMSEVETEVIVSLESELPKNELMVKFMHMFQEIEKSRENLRVDSSGLSYSTLEDVFLNVGSDLEWNGLNEDNIENERLQLSRAEELNSGPSLIFSQLLALLTKRFHYARRHWLMFVFQIVIPGLIMLLAVVTQNNLLSTFSGKTTGYLELNTVKMYGAGSKSYYYGDDTLREAYKSLIINQDKGELFFSGGDITQRQADDELLKSVDNNLANYAKHYLYGLGTNQTAYTVMVNYEQLHSIPLAINLQFESIIQTLLKSDKPSIKLVSNPVLNQRVKQQQSLVGIILPWVFTSLVFLPIAFPFLASSYIMFAIEENNSKSKLIQLMTKMSPAIYWIANYIFDTLCHLLAIGVLFVIIWIMDSHSVVFGKTANNAGLTLFLLMYVFGLSTIPIAYILSFKFAKASSGFVFMVIVFFLFGFLFNIFLSIVEFLRTFAGSDFMGGWYGGILSVVRVVPIFSFLFGYQKVYKLSCLSRVCDLIDPSAFVTLCDKNNTRAEPLLQGCCPNCAEFDLCYKDFNPFSATKYGAGIEVMYMVFCGIICFALIVLYEVYKVKILSRINKYFPESSSGSSISNASELSSQEDSDVERERARIEESIQSNADSDIFSVLHMRKNFGSFTAVDDLTFGVHHGECFGLLGVNGAGKTTTFSMLTGDLIPSSGNAFICNGQFSLVDELKEFQGRIGYCPQFDALLHRITGYETLTLFARLRGIPESNLARDIRNLIKMVGLEKHAHKLVGAYSGGNKRKLSIAVALIGNPQVLFLDEPSAGVDPAARRKIWQTLGYLKRNFNCSIILTSHSMEECEALCSRLGIMVNGRFRCLGSTQHLRSRYGQGYSVTISLKKELNENKDYVDRIQNDMRRVFPSAVMKDFHQGLMHYHITDPAERWSNIFTQMVQLNGTLDFEDYNVSDTTLEQIFLMFARHQKK